MRANKTQLITELEKEKQRLEMEVQKFQELKAARAIPAGNIVLSANNFQLLICC